MISLQETLPQLQESLAGLGNLVCFENQTPAAILNEQRM